MFSRRIQITLAFVLFSGIGSVTQAYAVPPLLLPTSTVLSVSSNPHPQNPTQARKQRPKIPQTLTPKRLHQLARRIILGLRFKQYNDVHSLFAPRVKKALPADKLKRLWFMVRLRMGTFKRIERIQTKRFRAFHFVMATCLFSNKRIIWRLVFNAQGQLAGMQFLPVAPRLQRPTSRPVRTSSKAKKPTRPRSFIEKTVVVQAQNSSWKLIGTLSIPKQAKAVPAVVLVHGSGPHDQDQTIGPNKIFRDIAWNLAAQGIAVLRYTKRTHAMAQVMRKLKPAQRKKKAAQLFKHITIQTEVMDDAIAAVQLLAQTPSIDPKRIFVLGHSLGGMVAPAIGAQTSQVAGLILMAAPSRSLPEIVLDQVMYLAMLDGKLTPQERTRIRDIARKLAHFQSGHTISKHASFFGMSGHYLRGLHTARGIKMLRTFAKPVLIVQGGRDYQVTLKEDFAGWKKAFKTRKHTTFKVYPALNHLFMAGVGASQPKEYLRVGRVSKTMLQDVGMWIKKQRAQAASSRPAVAMGAQLFIEAYARAYRSNQLQSILPLYRPGNKTISISSRGNRFVGFKHIREMYKNTFKYVRFIKVEATLQSYQKVGSNLICTARFSLTSFVRKNPKMRFLVQTQGSFVLTRSKGAWRIVHEHFSPIFGVPRLQTVK